MPEIIPRLKHTHKGTVSMAVAPAVEGTGMNGGCGSQFFITLADGIDYLDGKHAVFGHVVEGLETLDKLNDVFTDQDGRPLKDVRIRHVEILGELIDLSTFAIADAQEQMTRMKTRQASSYQNQLLRVLQTTRHVSLKMRTHSRRFLKRRKSRNVDAKPQ